MPESNLNDYLDGVDAAELFVGESGYFPSYDEWNAMRLSTGRRRGEFGEYLAWMGGDDGRHTGQTERLYGRGLCTAAEWRATRARLLGEA